MFELVDSFFFFFAIVKFYQTSIVLFVLSFNKIAICLSLDD